MKPSPLDPGDYRDIVKRALEEDLGAAGDITTNATVPSTARGSGLFLVKAECVLAGLDVAFAAFRMLDDAVQCTVVKGDGERCAAGDVVAEIAGSARTLLVGERTALNFLQRLSGIATSTRRFVDAAGGRITVLDTRKTTPGLRVLEKYAVRAGGGTNHRTGLDDGILIKDNHIRLAGGLKEAVARVKATDPEMRIEVEAQSLEQIDDAIAAGANIILFDNLSTEAIREGVKRVAGRAQIEISGNVRLERIPELAATGANYVSIGALTHSAPAADVSFELEPE